mgnify:CR=1 FL=1
MKAFKILLGTVCACSLFSCTTPAQQETKTEDGKNAVIETIMTRRSVRKYQSQAVNRDTMQIIMECGINAPNAINRQAWEIRIVDNPEVIQKLTELYLKDDPKEAENPNFKNMFRNAPTVAFIASRLRLDGGEHDSFGLVDGYRFLLLGWTGPLYEIQSGSQCISQADGLL